MSILSSQMPNISAIVITKILTLEHRAPGTYIMRHTKESAAYLQIWVFTEMKHQLLNLEINNNRYSHFLLNHTTKALLIHTVYFNLRICKIILSFSYAKQLGNLVIYNLSFENVTIIFKYFKNFTHLFSSGRGDLKHIIKKFVHIEGNM